MKYRHVFWAIILIAIGVLFMLDNLNVLDFGFWKFLSLWPLILILWGVSILPVKDWIKVVSLVLILALTVVFYPRITTQPWFDVHGCSRHVHIDRSDDETDTTAYQPQNLSVPFDSTVTASELKLQAAAGKYNVEGMTSDMLSFNKRGDIGDYSLTTTSEGTKKRISLEIDDDNRNHSLDNNRVDIRLTDRTPWNLDLDIGAAEVLLDLREYRVDTLKLQAGAAAIRIKAGEKSPAMNMEFNAGAASIAVEVPKASGCRVKSESFLVTKEFEGFKNMGDGIYQTENYETAPNKIQFTLQSAFAKIEIRRY